MKTPQLILLTVLASALTAYGQTTQAVSARQKESFLANPQVKRLIANFKEKGFTAPALVPEGTKTWTGRDASGEFSVSLITYTLTSKTRNRIDVAMFSNNATRENTVWAENEKEIFKVTGAAITTAAQPKGPPTATAKSASDCFKKYGKGAIQNCSSCFSCVNNCWNKNAKWKRIACAATNCGGSCWKCITNVYAFVVCIFD